MNTNFIYGQYSKQTEALYKKLLSLYKNYQKDNSAEKLMTNYTELAKEEKISVSFVGQYSSGKSTIIKSLTGEQDILIDADIATGQVTSYEWGSFLLNDTPGLQTGEKEEHDKMTLDAIERSDLLVYCITSDLFSNITKNDFKKLAEQYRTKIFLVINKMSAESGEYDELVKNYTDSINKTLSPEYSIVDFHHFFVDAKDYLIGISEKDEDYIIESHFNDFIKKLNDFIGLKGLKGKLLTPLNILKNSIEEMLIDIETDEHIKEGRCLIKKICDTIEEKKRLFLKTCNEDVQRTANKIINKGDNVAINLGVKGYEFNNKAFQGFIEPLQTELCEKIKNYFEQYASEVDEEVNKVINSEMAQHFFEEQKRRIDKTYKNNKQNVENVEEFGKDVSEATAVIMPKITNWLAKAANVSDGAKISIWTVNGSNLHKLVKNVGHFFGHKFKPFEALKITKKIAKIVDLLGPILTGFGVFIEGLEWLMRFLGEKKIKKVKDEIKSVFKEVSEDTTKYYNEQVNNAAKEFESIRNSLQDELAKLENESSQNDSFRKELCKIKSEISKLRDEIEG